MRVYLTVKLNRVIDHAGFALRVEAVVQGAAVCFGIGDQSPDSYFYSPDNKFFFGWYFLLIISQSF